MIELSVDPNGGIETEGYEAAVSSLTGYETTDYRLLLTTNIHGIEVFQIQNIKYGVIEYEDHVLHRILDMMQDTQAALSRSVKRYVPPLLSIVEKEDEVGEDRIH
jgi:hypothetical protein